MTSRQSTGIASTGNERTLGRPWEERSEERLGRRVERWERECEQGMREATGATTRDTRGDVFDAEQGNNI